MKEGTLPLATITPLMRPHRTPTAQAGRIARTPMLPDVFAANSAAIATIAPTGNDHEGHAERRDEQHDGLLRDDHEIVELKKARGGEREGDSERDEQEDREEAAHALASKQAVPPLTPSIDLRFRGTHGRLPHVLCRMIASSDAEAGSSMLATIRPARMIRMRSLSPISSLRSSLAMRTPSPRSAASRSDR